MKEGFIAWIKQQNRKKTKAGGDEAARSNKRGRQEVQWGKCTEVIWGLNIPAGVRHRTHSGFREEKSCSKVKHCDFSACASLSPSDTTAPN